MVSKKVEITYVIWNRVQKTSSNLNLSMFMSNEFSVQELDYIEKNNKYKLERMVKICATIMTTKVEYTI